MIQSVNTRNPFRHGMAFMTCASGEACFYVQEIMIRVVFYFHGVSSLHYRLRLHNLKSQAAISTPTFISCKISAPLPNPL